MLGIGAAQQKDPNGIAWKQNKDFESLLKRLNEAAAAEETNTPSGEAKDKEGGVDEGETASEKKEKKRKRKKDREGATEEKAKKRRKSEDSGDSDKEPVKSASETAEVEVTPVVPPKPYLPRYRAYVPALILRYCQVTYSKPDIVREPSPRNPLPRNLRHQ